MLNTTWLLIDDDVEEHELFAMAVQQVDPDLACITVESGIEAVEQLRNDSSFTPKLIFLDMNMPGMDGRQCLTELKKLERLKSTPIIMYTTSTNPDHVQETKALGATGYIVKPAVYTDLVQALNKVVRVPDWQGTSYFYFSKIA